MKGLQKVLALNEGWEKRCGAGALPVLQAINRCRTPALGYHLYNCDQKECTERSMQYHSCRNRHCPHCGESKKLDWIDARMNELLPCPYFHIVFTLPHELHSLCLGNRKPLFELLFDASAYTLKVFAKDKQHLGAEVGIISVLHTWGQQLSFHPHVHSIVSGYGWDKDKELWVKGKKADYGRLFPVKAMRKVYRGYMLNMLNEKWPEQMKSLNAELKKKEWIVYAKAPMSGPQEVIEYLGRYTHKIAISNHRIKEVYENGDVSFDYKDYADGSRIKNMTVSGDEFLRRFEQHILPKGFCKIRSYGIYGNSNRRKRIERIRKVINPKHKEEERGKTPWYLKFSSRYGIDPLCCKKCGKGKMKLVAVEYNVVKKVKPTARAVPLVVES